MVYLLKMVIFHGYVSHNQRFLSLIVHHGWTPWLHQIHQISPGKFLVKSQLTVFRQKNTDLDIMNS